MAANLHNQVSQSLHHRGKTGYNLTANYGADILVLLFSKMVALDAAIAVCTLMAGCCSNVVFLEYLINMSSNSGNVIIFFQYVFTAAEGLVTYSKFGKTRRIIPLRSYLFMVLLFVTVTVTNIISLNCNIPIPLHTVFKSGSLVANLFVGKMLLKRSYSTSKYVAVFFLSIGIFICTLATAQTIEVFRSAKMFGFASYLSNEKFLLDCSVQISCPDW